MSSSNCCFACTHPHVYFHARCHSHPHSASYYMCILLLGPRALEPSVALPALAPPLQTKLPKRRRSRWGGGYRIHMQEESISVLSSGLFYQLLHLLFLVNPSCFCVSVPAPIYIFAGGKEAEQSGRDGDSQQLVLHRLQAGTQARSGAIHQALSGGQETGPLLQRPRSNGHH